VVSYPQALVKIALEANQTSQTGIDRTQWQARNLFVVSVVWDKRAIPVYWQLLSKIGSSNLAEQKALLRPVLRLLKNYQIILVADREFHSIKRGLLA
jgi:hypothetical protein